MAQMEKITGGRTTGEKVKTGILGFFLNFLMLLFSEAVKNLVSMNFRLS